jgi:hypothetical protein
MRPFAFVETDTAWEVVDLPIIWRGNMTNERVLRLVCDKNPLAVTLCFHTETHEGEWLVSVTVANDGFKCARVSEVTSETATQRVAGEFFAEPTGQIMAALRTVPSILHVDPHAVDSGQTVEISV